MSSERRAPVWVVPALFALVALSVPAQVLVREHVAEPYPGLFLPSFAGIPGHGATVRVHEVVLEVDGRVIDRTDLLPASNRPESRRVLESMFPPFGGRPRVDDATRAELRTVLTESLGNEPHVLTARWERRRFDPDTRRTTIVKRLATYRVALDEDAR